MADMLDYIEWRGDITFKQSPFNEVDNIIMSQIAYVDLKNIVPDIKERGCITLEEASGIYFKLHDEESLKQVKTFIWQAPFLMRKAAHSDRFKNIKLGRYRWVYDEKRQTQFAAFTVDLGDGTVYIAYMGTDDTIVGWKEDFNMSFKAPVPSQLQALDYLEMIAKKKRGKFRIGGHSKGGNVAVYAAAFTGSEIQKRILQVHNFDGPGFTKDIIDQMSQGEIGERIRTIVPQSSVIGMLLEHEESYEVVASTQLGIFQHDMFSWQLQRNAFVKVDDISASAYKVDHTLREFILSMNAEEKEEFVESFFCVLTETGAKTLSDLNLKEILAIMKRLNKEEKENKKILTQAFRMLLKIPTKKQL